MTDPRAALETELAKQGLTLTDLQIMLLQAADVTDAWAALQPGDRDWIRDCCPQLTGALDALLTEDQT